MYVQLALILMFYGNRENLRFKSCAAANFAGLACHKRADAIARKLALGLLIESLHLRHEAFKRLCNFLPVVTAQVHLHWFAICAEVKRFFKFAR